jgi:hypothetical protein
LNFFQQLFINKAPYNKLKDLIKHASIGELLSIEEIIKKIFVKSVIEDSDSVHKQKEKFKLQSDLNQL